MLVEKNKLKAQVQTTYRNINVPEFLGFRYLNMLPSMISICSSAQRGCSQNRLCKGIEKMYEECVCSRQSRG